LFVAGRPVEVGVDGAGEVAEGVGVAVLAGVQEPQAVLAESHVHAAAPPNSPESGFGRVVTAPPVTKASRAVTVWSGTHPARTRRGESKKISR
jgi:hypothetical protein